MLGRPPCGPHDVYVLTTPIVEEEITQRSLAIVR